MAGIFLSFAIKYPSPALGTAGACAPASHSSVRSSGRTHGSALGGEGEIDSGHPGPRPSGTVAKRSGARFGILPKRRTREPGEGSPVFKSDHPHASGTHSNANAIISRSLDASVELPTQGCWPPGQLELQLARARIINCVRKPDGHYQTRQHGRSRPTGVTGLAPWHSRNRSFGNWQRKRVTSHFAFMSVACTSISIGPLTASQGELLVTRAIVAASCALRGLPVHLR